MQWAPYLYMAIASFAAEVTASRLIHLNERLVVFVAFVGAGIGLAIYALRSKADGS